MPANTTPPKPSPLNIIFTSLPKVPWKDFLCGLFAPLILMQICGHFHAAVIGSILAIAWGLVFFVVDLIIRRQPNMFALITILMISTQFTAGMFAAHHSDWASTMQFVPILDNVILASLFFVSLLTKKPLILLFLGKETLESVPEKIRKSSYHLTGWRMVTLIWGILYAIQPIFHAYLIFHRSPIAEFIDNLFGWPVVVVLLILSVSLPRWYWIKNMPLIEKEIAGNS